MNSLRIIGLMTGVVLLTSTSFSQNEIEALRYSQQFSAGTARFAAMGGAFGALGGDFSSLTVNPAGIAIYRKSEIMLTPSIFSSSSNTRHYGTKSYGNKTNFNFSNIGIVATFNSNSSGWVSSSVGFGYNRMNNFTSRYTIEGTQDESSLLDMFKNQIEENVFNPNGSDLAWQTFLIDYDTVNGGLITAIPKSAISQRKTINRSGSLGETVFSFGGNYNNKFYLGGTVGFTRIRFSETSDFAEITDKKDTTILLQSYRLVEDISTSGSGINFKMGMIYRINDFVRIGGAVHSPTYYDISDKWDATINAEFRDSVNDFTQQGQADYSLMTPFKAIGSMAFIFGKSGLLSVDYEFLDYSLARLSGSGTNNYSYSSENNIISENYMAAGNVRIGTEWKISPFSIRAGFTNYGNPFGEGVGNKSSAMSYTGGFGIREDEYFIDLAYVYTKTSENYYLYDPALIQPTKMDLINQSVLLTLGVRF